MDRIVQLHSRLQVTISLALAALAVWGLVCFLRGGIGSGYGAGLAIVQLLLLAEGLLGLVLLLAGAEAGRLVLHLVYGAVAILLLPAVALANRGRSGRREALTYAAVCLLLLGVAIRAAVTG